MKNGIVEPIITKGNNKYDKIYNFGNVQEFKPETIEYINRLYSQNTGIVAEMLHSENTIEVAVAKTVLEVLGIPESDIQ